MRTTRRGVAPDLEPPRSARAEGRAALKRLRASIRYVTNDIATLLFQRCCDGEHSFDEAAARLAMRTEAGLAHQRARPERAFSDAIRWLHADDAYECTGVMLGSWVEVDAGAAAKEVELDRFFIGCAMSRSHSRT